VSQRHFVAMLSSVVSSAAPVTSTSDSRGIRHQVWSTDQQDQSSGFTQQAQSTQWSSVAWLVGAILVYLVLIWFAWRLYGGTH
jgi:hypothetical protein